jgi:hypothetical protein
VLLRLRVGRKGRGEVWCCGGTSGEEWWYEVERVRKQGGFQDDRCCGGCRRARWVREEDRVDDAVEVHPVWNIWHPPNLYPPSFVVTSSLRAFLCRPAAGYMCERRLTLNGHLLRSGSSSQIPQFFVGNDPICRSQPCDILHAATHGTSRTFLTPRHTEGPRPFSIHRIFPNIASSRFVPTAADRCIAPAAGRGSPPAAAEGYDNRQGQATTGCLRSTNLGAGGIASQ